MPNFVVPDAAAQGAFYPDGSPANFYLNNTGAKGWVVHLSGGGWRFAGGSDGASDDFVSDGIRGGSLLPMVGSDGRCYQGCDGILSDDPAMYVQLPSLMGRVQYGIPCVLLYTGGGRECL